MRRVDATRARGAAFTFVEMLVVLMIISALCGLIVPALWTARSRADRDVCRQEITRLCLAVENFADNDRYADFPPVTLKPLGIGDANEINAPNESLVLCLATRRGEGPYFDFEPDRLVNVDGDEGPENVLGDVLRVPFPGPGLREYVDQWLNPYIYVPYRAYGATINYSAEEGVEFEAQLAKDPATGTWPAPFKFVIWSCGPNGINENGGGDDIVSWD